MAMTSASANTWTSTGRNQIEPTDSTSPSSSATSAAPRKLPMPPATTTMKALMITSEPTVV